MNKTQLEKDLMFNNFFADKKHVIGLFLIVAVLILTLCTVFFIESKKQIKINNEQAAQEQEAEPVYYSSTYATKQLENATLTDLEQLGVEERMFIGEKGKTICANCAKPLTVYDSPITMVLTQDASFLKVVLCRNCFVPMGDLFKEIGF